MSGTTRGGERIEIAVPEARDGDRLDRTLAEMTELSRSRVQKLLREGCVEGPVARPSGRVAAGERYLIRLPANERLALTPEAIELDVLYEDAHLVVVNKPAGMVVHPAHGHTGGTLVHALLHHCPDLPGIGGVERPGIVHRLDRGTSGSLVVAKSELAHQRLVAMFAAHDLERQYLAWCRGAPTWRRRRIDLPVGRHPRHRKKMAVTEGGRRAVTEAELERRYRHFCRLRLTLHTGRTHQIRVHLSHEHLPILGDPVYARAYNPGREIAESARRAIAALTRPALHAELLAFDHPITGESVRCVAPLPDDLRSLSRALEAHDA